MGKGRKKTPDGIKVMKGTDQKCRLTPKTVLPAVISKVPPAPTWFTPLAKKIYKDVTRELQAKNLLQVVGLTMIVSYCNLMALHLQLEQEMKYEGRIITVVTNNGSFDSPNPKHKISMDSLEKARQIASEFGFTPISQQRIIIQVTKQDENDKFFN